MLSLGLSTADQKLFERSLISGYNLKVRVHVLTLDHRHVADVSAQLLDGQVDKSYWDAVTSMATLTLLDPDSMIGFDTQSPSDGALFADRMIRIYYCVWSELLPRWVDVPLFTGPVTKVDRDDAVLSVECQGKESLYTEPSMGWTAKTYYKGSSRVSAIRDALANRGGETRFDFPEASSKMPKDQTLRPETPIWNLVSWIAGSRSYRQLFYDGRGVARFRPVIATPAFVFTEHHLTSVPKLSYDMSAVRNTVLVKGSTPEGKPQITARRYLPTTDPASPTSLGRNGVKRHLVEVVDDPGLLTQAAANAAADTALERVRVGNINFDFDSFPVPHLEPGDPFHLSTRDVSINLRTDKFSIPLKAGNSQANGAYRRVSSNRRRIRR